ncbi:protein D7-like [Amyelois transitella]|uniref:protein D7-like n=1 Tax=Amyelois transitella TaxID=680683 RepID=UPI00067B3758|nr:protein D7-like [Amyelois transitella]
MDDPFVSCPYDSAHRVPRSRIQGHIVKCQQKCPNLHICPYNATHRGTEAEMKIHIKDCPTKLAMFPENRPPRVTGDLTTPKPLLQKEYIPETDPNHEIWDD